MSSTSKLLDAPVADRAARAQRLEARRPSPAAHVCARQCSIGVEVVEGRAGLQAALAGGDACRARVALCRIDLADDEHSSRVTEPLRSARARAPAPTTSSAPPSPYISAVSITASRSRARVQTAATFALAGAPSRPCARCRARAIESCTLPGNARHGKMPVIREQDDDHPMTTDVRRRARRPALHAVAPHRRTARCGAGEARLRIDSVRA